VVHGEHEEDPPGAARPFGGGQQQGEGVAAAGQRHGDRPRQVRPETTVEDRPDRGPKVEFERALVAY
jgi:hypothetical protein